jgi:hypothetical protein
MSKSRDRFGWERLSDVQVPRGIHWWVMLATWLRQRQMRQAIDQFATATAQFGTFLGTRMREGDEREKQLLGLQSSVERLTRWLVRLTIVLGVIGIAGIGATLWAALK